VACKLLKSNPLVLHSSLYSSFLRESLRHGFGATDWLVDVYPQQPPSPPNRFHSPLLSRGHSKSFLTIEIRGRSDRRSGCDGGSESEVEGRGFGTGGRGRGTLYELSVQRSIESSLHHQLQRKAPSHQDPMGSGSAVGEYGPSMLCSRTDVRGPGRARCVRHFVPA